VVLTVGCAISCSSEPQWTEFWQPSCNFLFLGRAAPRHVTSRHVIIGLQPIYFQRGPWYRQDRFAPWVFTRRLSVMEWLLMRVSWCCRAFNWFHCLWVMKTATAHGALHGQPLKFELHVLMEIVCREQRTETVKLR